MPFRTVVLISENIVLREGHNLFGSRRNSNSNDYLMAKVERDNRNYVISLHVANSFDDELFYATMINQERFEQINKWINEDKNA